MKNQGLTNGAGHAPVMTEVEKTMKKLMILVATAAMALAPLSASAARIVVRGRAGFGPGFYAPGPYWGSYWGPAYAYPSANLGEVKIETKSKTDEVFVNGAFAGVTKDMKSFHLRPGAYNIEVRHDGSPALQEKVFVAAGKTIHLQPAL
jgi:hypothetical protein